MVRNNIYQGLIKIFVLLFYFGTLSISVGAKDSDEQPQVVSKKLTNEAIWASGEFRMDYLSGVNSMNDGIHFTSLNDGKSGQVIEKFKYANKWKEGGGELVVATNALKKIVGDENFLIDDYTFSADESKLLIKAYSEPIYRHSTKAHYYIYELKTKQLTQLSDQGKGKIRLAAFSPSAEQVGFVRNNNLFVYDIKAGSETAVTTDGGYNKIINGAPDWVYEEEFSFATAFYWSEEGNYIAYYKFDETAVKEFQMPIYGSLYPVQYTFKYPKAGETNSKVGIYIFDLKLGTSKVCDTGTEEDQYIPRVKWTKNDQELCVLRLNRLQNNLDYLLFDAKSTGGKLPAKTIFSETSKTYLEINDNLIFLKDKKSLLKTSEEDGYNHIYKVDFNGNKIQITKGNWDVTDLYGINEKKGLVYYRASEESAMVKDIYAIKLSGTGKKKISPKPGTNEAVFSKGMKYFINYNSNLNTPYFISMHEASGKEVYTIYDNKALLENLKAYNLPKKEFFQFTTSENITLNGWMVKPGDFDPSKKYPVFMTVYGGPGINTVNDSWGGANHLWHTYLAQEGYIVVSVDGRGTGRRGARFRDVTYGQLGKYETEDQIEAAKYLGALTYVDKNRIGIQGWSYGGYMASLCLSKGAPYFKMAIAVAPVTNWRFYDSIYTERYMGLPQKNASGYDDNSPINHVKKIKGSFLLVHGSADDNVHFQNSMEMMDELINNNIDFDQAIYPNKNHGIYGGITRLHLFSKMTRFIQGNL